MTRYVVGFVFNKSKTEVMLIEKQRPLWQKNHFNGIGGHIRKGKRGGISLYIQVKNVERSLLQAVELGGKKTMDPYQVPSGALIAGITDPEGNALTLVQQ